jgi:3-deoxy-manno-octulosonate cytidylyltransferase (CMP-KDO synthetase)
MRAVAVIPARMGSKRLPGKALADVHGSPLVVHVLDRVSRVAGLDEVYVATDSSEITAVVEAAGAKVIQTPGAFATGTDRVAAAMRGLDADVVINVQVDNGDLDPMVVEAVLSAFLDPDVQFATAVAPFPGDRDPADPSIVKAVVDRAGRAITFSRAPIPHRGPWLQHIGVYGFRRGALQQFAAWGRGGLEQLRILEHGAAIQTVHVAHAGFGIDTQADLDRLLSSFSDSSPNNRGCHA